MTTKKRLTSIKGISEAKVDKIKVFIIVAEHFVVYIIILHNVLCHIRRLLPSFL